MTTYHNLKTSHLSAGYREKAVITNIDIVIPKNKITVIIGKNGSGKSTLLKTFCRILTPMKGQVILDQKSILNYRRKELAKIIGLLSQFSNAPEGIKVADLVSRGRFPYMHFLSGLSDNDIAVIKKAMEIVNITDLANKNVDELSGGQKQRVWLAMALAQESDILLLDEPTTFLDIAYQVEILDLLKRLNETHKTTIVMVLHDLNASSRYADYIIAMENGRIFSKGVPEEIINPQTIKAVYGIDCVVIKDPVSGKPLVIPK